MTTYDNIYLLGNPDVLDGNEGTVKLCAHPVPGAQLVSVTITVIEDEPLTPGDVLVANADASELAVVAVENGTAVVRTASGFEVRPVADLRNEAKSRREIERAERKADDEAEPVDEPTKKGRTN